VGVLEDFLRGNLAQLVQLDKRIEVRSSSLAEKKFTIKEMYCTYLIICDIYFFRHFDCGVV
jgi:hypothetical protein